MGSGPSLQSRATSQRRVSSPSAAKTGAAPARPALAPLGWRDMALDVEHLLRPTGIIHPERFRPAPVRESVETGLDQRQQRAAARLFQPKLDERRRIP